MISKERLEELENYFWSETNDEETQEWREDLNDEEQELINEWDGRVNAGITTLLEETMKFRKDK